MIHRSAITGRFVTAKYAKRHPKTTVREDAGNVRKRALPPGHRLIKRYKPVKRRMNHE